MLRPLLVEVSDIWKSANYSLLKSTAVSGASTIDVYSISDFAIENILLIGEFGEEGSEIIKTHSSTAPSGHTITLSSNLVKDHSKDTHVYVIPYDYIEISHATTSTGSKSVLSTAIINPEHEEILYNDTSSTDGYYFTRYKNSITNLFSGYSDPIPFNGYDANTVGFIIYNVMSELGKPFSERLTYQTLVNKINSCLSFVRGKLKRWSHTQEFDYALGVLALDENSFTLPSSYYDKNSNKSVLSVKHEGKQLSYIDKKELDNIRHSETSGTPEYYTVYDGKLYISPYVSTEFVGDDITLDFYTDIVRVDSDTDVIPNNRYDMIENWLKWEIINITERNGKKDFKDGNYEMFLTILADAIRRESSGQKYKLRRKINGINYNQLGNNDFERS